MNTSPTLLPYITHKAIEEKADRLRQRAGAQSIPVDPIRIAKQLGISIFNATFTDPHISGMIRKVDGDTQILVSPNQSAERIRYTIAHELGHYELHFEIKNSFVDTDLDFFRRETDEDDPIKKRVEVQANMFAASLLMPATTVTEAYAISSNIDNLAGLFCVSSIAMKFRIANLGLGQ